jgi:hypothetical protein
LIQSLIPQVFTGDPEEPVYFSFFVSVFSQIVYSQIVNPANVNLEALSDTQIQKILMEYYIP